MELIKNDEFVADLNKKQLSVVASFEVEYPLAESGFLFETIHGHIASLPIAEGRYLPHDKGNPRRMDKDDFAFLSALGDDVRWVEFAVDKIKVGF